MNCRVSCSYNDKTFDSIFSIDAPYSSETEYLLEDKSWQITLLWAETIGRGIYGRKLDPYKMARILEDVEYHYELLPEEN